METSLPQPIILKFSDHLKKHKVQSQDWQQGNTKILIVQQLIVIDTDKKFPGSDAWNLIIFFFKLGHSERKFVSLAHNEQSIIRQLSTHPYPPPKQELFWTSGMASLLQRGPESHSLEPNETSGA